MDYRGGTPRQKGAHQRMTRGGVNQHQQPPRVMWPTNNATTYLSQDDTMDSYPQLPMDGYNNIPFASSEMISQGNPSTYSTYPPPYITPPMFHSGIDPVYLNTTIPMSTTPPIVNTSLSSKSVIAPSTKYNRRESVVTCAHCQHRNSMAESEIIKKDEEILQLNDEIMALQARVQELERLKVQESESAVTLNDALQHIDNITVSTKILSQLSPEAEEFSPKQTDSSQIASAISAKLDVPIVSVKGMNEESVSETHAHVIKEPLVQVHMNVESTRAPLNSLSIFDSVSINNSALEENWDEPAVLHSVSEAPQQSQPMPKLETSNCRAPKIVKIEEQDELNSQIEGNRENQQASFDPQILNSNKSIKNRSSDYESGSTKKIHIRSKSHKKSGDPERPQNLSFNSKDKGISDGMHQKTQFPKTVSQKCSGESVRDKDNRTRDYRDPPNCNQECSQKDSSYSRRERSRDNRDVKDQKVGGARRWENSRLEKFNQEDSSNDQDRNNSLCQINETHGFQSNCNKSQTWGPMEDTKRNDRGEGYKDQNNGGAWSYGIRKTPAKNIIKEFQADLFSAPNDFSLAHCVAKDFRMGSGIAVKFKMEFKRVSELLDQNVDVGGCAYLEDKNRYIFYLVTKSVSNGKPTYDSLRKSLTDMRDKCKQLNVTKLAIPRIGCGLDKLDWPRVKNIVNEVFLESDMLISAYEFNVEGLPEGEGSRPSPGIIVKYSIMELVTIDKHTALLFLGTEDGHLDTTAASINIKFRFSTEYKSALKTIGKVWCFKSAEYYIYSLIVSKTFKDKVTFLTMEECCRDLSKLLRKDKFEYVGIEAMVDWSDDTTFTEKVVTLLRNTLPRNLIREFWVCYREAKDDVHEMCKKNYVK